MYGIHRVLGYTFHHLAGIIKSSLDRATASIVGAVLIHVSSNTKPTEGKTIFLHALASLQSSSTSQILCFDLL